MTDTQKHQVVVEDVYMEYPNPAGGIKKVLNDIDLRISAGEFITVVGPTGCGKSTLFRLILGEEKPTQGKVLIDGKPVESPDRNKGVVYQRYSLFPHKTVADNITFGLEFEGFNLFSRFAADLPLVRRFYQNRFNGYRIKALEYLRRIGLDPADADKRPDQLSGGMEQRVAIAQALIMKPKVLLMDEPFGALDDATRRVMQSLIVEKWKENKQTILFVTHDLEEAIFLGTRIIVLSQYYSADSEVAGAKIVLDKAIPFSQSHDFKSTPEFAVLEQQIRRDGLDPSHRQHVKDFELSHPDSFRTVTPKEWKR
ncbi:MAG: ABC transporter ATP-binding protein [Candidatus Colwellbacteria bacterium]|nr:ABC transporter ATP-binding protein [Candidatus Colwellbacteria bacterium]